MCQTCGSNWGTLACQADTLPIELPRPALLFLEAFETTSSEVKIATHLVLVRCLPITVNNFASLFITLPKKGNLQLCQNYRTISLISHPSKVRRASRFQSRKEHHRTNIQSQDSLREIPAASAESLPCLHRLQEGL